MAKRSGGTSDGGNQSLMEVVTEFPDAKQPTSYLLRCKFLVDRHRYKGYITCNRCNESSNRFRQYDLALDHALSHMEIPIFPCAYCYDTHSTHAALADHLDEVHGANMPSISDLTHIMEQHRNEIFRMIALCFGPKICRPRRDILSGSRETNTTRAPIHTNPILLRRIKIDEADCVTKYVKSKLIATYKPGTYIRCLICHHNLGYLRHGSESVVTAAYVHMFNHSDICPFVCDYCKYAGKSIGVMAEHLNSDHPEYASSTRTTNAITNNTLQYKKELMELVNQCYIKNELYQNDQQCAMRVLGKQCQRTAMEYLKPGCALECLFCGAVLSELWIPAPTTSNNQSTKVAFNDQAAFEHVLEHCNDLKFKCRHCNLIAEDYIYMKRHVQWIHQSDFDRGVHLMDAAKCYDGIGKMIDRCFSKNLKDAREFVNMLEEIPAAKKRRVLETAPMPYEVDNGVSTISSSLDQAASENDQESKVHPMAIAGLDSGISSDIESSAGSSGWTVKVKCEVTDSDPVLVSTDEWFLKEPKKEEPEFDGSGLS